MKRKYVHTVEEFNAWLKTAKQDDRVIYNVGRYADTWASGGGQESLATVVYQASERAEVVLFQYRMKEAGFFQYTATRSMTPRSVAFWGAAPGEREYSKARPSRNGRAA